MNARSLAVAMLLVLTGCTSMSPVKSKTLDLGTQIRSGHVVARGDHVEIVTTDGERHRFQVTAIDESAIRGSEIAVPIDTIVELKVRKFSTIDSVVLVGGITAVLWTIVVMAASGLAISGMAGP